MELEFRKLIEILEKNSKEIKNLLVEYQPVSVTQYEIDRCVYTLKNINKLQKYLGAHTGIKVSVFLPSNLPLYSLLLFAIIPSFISKSVVVRTSSVLVGAASIEGLFRILELGNICPNVSLFSGNRDNFLLDHVAQSNLVIFTGRNETKDKVKKYIKPGAFMINNGSGHNPIIITESADIYKAVEGVTYTKFFNAGQDCAGPDAIFVHKKIRGKFVAQLKEKVSKLKVGNHRGEDVIVGKILREEELDRLQAIIDNNKLKIILGGKVDKENKIVYPTIIQSDITSDDLNYKEIFGPILFIYTYDNNNQLKLYFEDQDGRYVQNKMYVSVFADRISGYILSKNVGIILHNKIVHDEGIDNGFTPYGGYSRGASSIIHKDIKGKLSSIAIPILVPEIMHKLFVERKVLRDLVLSKRSMVTDQRVVRHNVSTEFIDGVKGIFGKGVLFAFIFGSVAKGTFEKDKSDIDTLVCTRKEDKKSNECFLEFMEKLHLKYGFKPDEDYPSEIVSYHTLVFWMYDLYYQLYGENYFFSVHENRFDCSFFEQFRCHDSRTDDIIFWASILAEKGNKIGLTCQDKKALNTLVANARELIPKITAELLQNIAKTKATKVEALKKRGDDCEILREAVEWRPSKEKLDNDCEIFCETVEWPRPSKELDQLQLAEMREDAKGL
ncbi:MAG: aldehyde dehydrogenase family protein [Wolbachia endosymbiont of Tyrophagus putrescentiae]|nr:aldehyde dehydrogenase family protein [Wolbachia endosymbiont of Tyrophagus putrescentiae]